jgi:hypothetical protein
MTTYTLNDGSLLCWSTATWHSNGDAGELRVGLRWTPEEPYAVSVEFIHRLTAPVTWVLSRDTLLDGMRHPSGDGDYRVFRPSPPWVALHLSSPSGQAQFVVAAGVLGEFLSKCYHLCPRGSEYAGWDVDAELASILAEESA